MSERDNDDNNNNPLSQENHDPLLCLNILLNSLQIFLRNKRIFSLVFALATFPLSYLLFSFSLSARPIKARVYHLEALVHFASTHVEADHVAKESRDDAIYLFRLRFLYFFPTYFLSLVAAVTAVNCTHSAVNGRRFNLQTAVTSFRLTWKRPLVTSICVYVVLVLYSQVVFFLDVTLGNSLGHTLFIRAFGSSLEVYIMAVLGVGLVVSILEDKFAFDAIRVGSGLMEGRRASGWVFSGWFVLVSGLIGWRWEKLMEMMDGQDRGKRNRWTVVMESWENVGLICLYGIEVIWSYVVTTVFYCECRKRHVIRCENDSVVPIF